MAGEPTKAITKGQSADGDVIVSEALGCRLNMLEREAMESLALQSGLTNAVIINSCAVTHEAVRQTQKLIRRHQRAGAGTNQAGQRPIIVTGCAADIVPQEFSQEFSKSVLLLKNKDKLNPAVWARLARGEDITQAALNDAPASSTHFATPAPHAQTNSRHTRAFLHIQNGCDHGCTFCIIPKGRGKSLSRPLFDILAACEAVCAQGAREIVLTGVDLTSYRCPIRNEPLGAVVARILARVPELKRLRLSSLDCIEIDPLLGELIASEPRLMPHLHLSIQAGDDMILKRMKRRHLRKDVLELCASLKAKRKELVFGADLIAGFPTETDAMFCNTLALVREVGITHGHVFPYSPRSGTPAARMPQLERALIIERAKMLRSECARLKADHEDAKIGTRQEILLEHGFKGYSPDYSLVRLTGAGHDGLSRGAVVPVVIAGRDEKGLYGAPAPQTHQALPA